MPLTRLPRKEDAFSSSRPIKRTMWVIKSAPDEYDMLLELLDTKTDVNPDATKTFRQSEFCIRQIS